MLDNIELSDNLVPYKTLSCNVVKNTFDNMVEIVYYKQPFTITTGNFGGVDEITGEVFLKGLNADRSRKFKEENGVLVPLKDSQKILNVQNTIKNSRKRALDNIFGYVLSNTWKYFLTLTFDPHLVDRDNDESVKYAWQKFRQTLQYHNVGVKILAIPERHPRSNKLHLHCLVGDIDLSSYMTRAINPHTLRPIFSKGRAVYNLNLFNFGFSTVVKVDENNLKVANYLTKYVIKDFGNIGYNKKTHFATHNLNFKNKEYVFLDDKSSIEFFNTYVNNGLTTKYKENDKMVVYRMELPFKELL